jgi:glycosyltransferase involved in cell wall biosynthesis
MKKILFLHTELSGYFLACIDTLVQKFDTEVHVVKLPVNKEAPFVFSVGTKITFYERNNYSDAALYSLCVGLNPDFIFCAGWIDKTYLKISKYYFHKIPTVLVLDNHWTGSLRQKMAVIASPSILLRRFSHIWIPGLIQYEYARKLGFKKEFIITGMYSADVPKFHDYYKAFKNEKQAQFPKRFLYIGRYIESKGVVELWEAFKELQATHKTNWELWCAGAGKLEKQFPKHPKIKNFGFVQPENLNDLIRGAGVFVLPSHFEPWGVVIHESAASGMPLVCSTEVGAAATFLINGYNGFSFRSKDKMALKKSMLRIMELSDSELQAMSERSITLSDCINPLIWATKIWEITTGI